MPSQQRRNTYTVAGFPSGNSRSPQPRGNCEGCVGGSLPRSTPSGARPRGQPGSACGSRTLSPSRSDQRTKGNRRVPTDRPSRRRRYHRLRHERLSHERLREALSSSSGHRCVVSAQGATMATSSARRPPPRWDQPAGRQRWLILEHGVGEDVLDPTPFHPIRVPCLGQRAPGAQGFVAEGARGVTDAHGPRSPTASDRRPRQVKR